MKHNIYMPVGYKMRRNAKCKEVLYIDGVKHIELEAKPKIGKIRYWDSLRMQEVDMGPVLDWMDKATIRIEFECREEG